MGSVVSFVLSPILSWRAMADQPAGPPDGQPPADGEPPAQPPPPEIDENDPDHVSYLRALVLKYRFTNKELAYFFEVCTYLHPVPFRFAIASCYHFCL